MLAIATAFVLYGAAFGAKGLFAVYAIGARLTLTIDTTP